MTSFVGRDADLAVLEASLSAHDGRLVTITGPGGVGKTTLAAAVRRHVEGPSEFVALADVHDAQLIPATIVRALGLDAIPGQSADDAVVAGLGDRPMLLVLDNLEHLDAAPFVAHLLDRCPPLRILATSRAPLGVTGEHVHLLAPLDVPERGSALAADAPAVQLFADRVRLVLPEFRLTAGNVADVVDVCRAVDGLPLAIELAAARCRQMAPRTLAARLRDRPLTTGTSPDREPRHRTLEATVTWSVDLLDPPVAALWRAVGAFDGGFTIDAADAVADAIGLDRASVPAMLDVLEAHQLVRLGTDSLGEPRYSVLRITREVALAALCADDRLDAVLEARAEAMARCCAEAGPGLRSADGATWFARIDAEIPNIRAVLTRDRAAGERVRPLTMVTNLQWFWTDPGYLHEGLAWFTDLLSDPRVEADESVPPALRAAALAAASSLAVWLCQTRRALELGTQALEIARRGGDRAVEMEVMLQLGNVYLDESDLVPAEQYFREGHVIAHDLQDMWHMAAFANLRATVASAQGDTTTAVAWHRTAMSGWSASGYQSHFAFAATGLAYALARAGDLDESAAVLSGAVPLLERDAVTPEAAMAIVGSALIACGIDLPEPAVRLLGAATALSRTTGLDFRAHVRETVTTHVAALRQTLPAPVFSRAWTAGLSMSLHDALDAVTTLVDDMPARLTARERDVLQLLVDGASDAQIAERLYISRHTASKHVASILDKLGAPNRTTAVALAYRRGLVTS